MQVYICDLHGYESEGAKRVRGDWVDVCADEMYEWYRGVHREERIIERERN